MSTLKRDKKSLLITNPDLANEWDYEKNAPLTPDEITYGSNKKVWWICSQCGNQWAACISSRASGAGCPLCGRKKQINSFRKRRIRDKGSLIDTHPILCSEWNYEKNKKSPSEYSYGSDYKVWWICKKGHEWEATIASRVSGVGCPKCNAGYRISLPEKTIVFYLNRCNIEVIENARIFNNCLRDVDIFLPSLNCAIEYDGEHWHKNKIKDLKKTELCKQYGIRLFRIREPKIGLLNDGYSEEHITAHPKNDLKYINESIKWLIRELELAPIEVDANRDMPLIRAMIEKNYDKDSFGNIYPEIAKEWDYRKNGGLNPNDLSKCSGIKVWWLCSLNHSWQDSVAHRIYGRACPYCSGKRTLPGFNDLKTKHPNIASEWDYDKNINLNPAEISDCNAKKVWWKCSNGHSYLASIAHRTSINGTGCPYCTNQKVLLGYNDLLSQYSFVANEWNYKLNSGMNPEDVVSTSNKRVWWICSICGHEWKAPISCRTRMKTGCPQCSSKMAGIQHREAIVKQKGSLRDTFPKLIEEWDYELNNNIVPDDYSSGSNLSVWWKCKCCGNRWQAKIANRTILGRGCPACAIKTRSLKKHKAVICVENNKLFTSVNEAAAFVGVSPSKISACCRGEQKTSGGFHWKYSE